MEHDLWKQYFHAEQQLFSFLNDATAVYTNKPAVYSEQPETGFMIAPHSVSTIIQLNDKADTPEFLQLKSLTDTAYQQAKGKAFKRFNFRHARYVENVEQINIAHNDAYRSKAFLPTGSFSMMYSNHESDVLERDKNRLDELAISYRVTHRLGTVYLEIQNQDLFAYWGNPGAVQMRLHTGKHTIARIRKTGETKSDKYPCGLIVVDAESTFSLYHATPQATRPHTLVRNAPMLAFPLDTQHQFFDKTAL